MAEAVWLRAFMCDTHAIEGETELDVVMRKEVDRALSEALK